MAVMRSSKPTEEQEQAVVAQWIRLHYPDVIFHSDFGAGAKLTASQAVRQSRLNGGFRAWPDLCIAQPVFDEDGEMIFAGLFIELKRSGTRLAKKNGDWASDHIAEQSEMLKMLRMRGYCAEFAIGAEDAIELITDYMEGKE